MRRGQSKFKMNSTESARPLRAPAQRGDARKPARAVVRRRLGGASVSTTTTTPTPPSSSRRPYRVASRRRLVNRTLTTTTPTSKVVSEEKSQDIDDNGSIEDPALVERKVPLKKTVKVQRRPLTSLKDKSPNLKDQNSSASTDEQSKRQSKKFSSSFKQNQLDEVIRQKSKSQEVTDGTTEGTTSDDISAETAIAIATHQLLAAPLPSTENFDDEPKSTKKQSNSKTSTTQQYNYTPEYTEPIGYTNTEGTAAGNKLFYSSTPSSTVGYTSSAPYATTSRSPPSSFTSLPRVSSSYSTAGILSSSAGFSGVSPPQFGPSTARYVGSSEKYISIPIEEFGYSTDGYTGGLSQEPVYFTREYLLESPVTRTYDDEYQYLSPITTPQSTTRKPTKKNVYKKISTTLRPTQAAPAQSTAKARRAPARKPFEKVKPKAEPNRTYRPIENYDYYDDSDEKLVGKYADGAKVIVHGKGSIECLDIGNFPHPTSCKKFISCARMEGGATVGWEYVCPIGLSFDPVGGICNWSAGLGCDEN